MKKWNAPAVITVELNETAHQWKFSCSRDGGYLGDGKLTGWFGPDPVCPTPTPTPDPTPVNPVTPDHEPQDFNS